MLKAIHAQEDHRRRPNKAAQASTRLNVWTCERDEADLSGQAGYRRQRRDAVVYVLSPGVVAEDPDEQSHRPMLVVKQKDGGGMATIDLRQRDID